MVSKFVSWLAGGFGGHSWLVGAETCLLLVGWVGGLLGSGEAEVPRQETEFATSVGRCAQLNHLQTKDPTVRLFTRESWGVGAGLCSVGRGGGRPQISFHCGCLGGLWPRATSWGCQGPGILALEVPPSPEAEPSGGALEGTGWAAREDDGSPVQVGGWTTAPHNYAPASFPSPTGSPHPHRCGPAAQAQLEALVVWSVLKPQGQVHSVTSVHFPAVCPGPGQGRL